MEVTETPAAIPGRSLGAGEGMAWIAGGWRLFMKAPLMWILAVLVILVIDAVLGFVPVLGQIAGALIKPIFFAGLMVACRSLDSGGDFDLEHVFAGFRHRRGNLLILAIVLLAVVVGIIAIGVGFISLTVGLAAFTHGLDDFNTAVATAAPILIVAGLAMVAMLLPVFMAYWFSPALIVLNGVPPGEAMKASLMGTLRNFVPFLLYAIVMCVLALIASIPFGLGLLVWAPVAMTSTYCAYRAIFTRPDPAAAPA